MNNNTFFASAAREDTTPPIVTLTAYWNGAVGDVGPRLTNGRTVSDFDEGDIRYTEELRGVAATDALRAYSSKGGYHSGKLEIFTDEVRLPRKDLLKSQVAKRRDFICCLI